MCAADVPDAPLKLEISEISSPRNISLSWVPGSDHNSSVTGNLEVFGVCYAVCALCCFKSSTLSSQSSLRNDAAAKSVFVSLLDLLVQAGPENSLHG